MRIHKLIGTASVLVLALGIISQSRLSAMTWNNGGGDSGWSASSASLDWTGASWSNSNDAFFGATGVGAITLNSPIAANSLTFTTSGYTLNGSNTLSVGSGGVTTSVSEKISVPIALASSQTWMVTGSSSVIALTVSGPISGTGAITVGGSVITQSSSLFLTSTATTIFANAQLANIVAVSGMMGGAYVNSGSPVSASGFFLNGNGTSATYQLQTIDESYTKCVKVLLTQDGNNIDAVELYAAYLTSGNSLGVNFDTATNSETMDLAKSQITHGYGQASTVIATPVQAYGKILLSGSNSYSGITTIATGTLQIGDGGNSGTLGSGAVVDNSLLAFDRGDNVLKVPNVISGSGALTVIGPGMVTLSGSNRYSGTTTVSAGTLQIGANGKTGTLGTGNVVDNSVLAVSRSDNALVISNSISGNGAVVLNGSGLVKLSGANSFTGGTIVTSGTLVLNGATSIRAGSTLTIGSGGSQAFAASPFSSPTQDSPALSAETLPAEPVPEPSALVMLAAAVLTFASVRRVFNFVGRRTKLLHS